MATALGNTPLSDIISKPGDPLVSPDGNTTVSANNDGTASITRPVTGGGTETRGLVVALPYDAEIEWLESTGTQYIDTGVVLGDSSEVRCRVRAEQTSGRYGLFGSRSGASSANVSGWINAGLAGLDFNNGSYGTYRVQASMADGDIIEASASATKRSVSVSGSTPTTSTNVWSGSFTTPSSCLICSINGTDWSLAQVRIFTFQIYEFGTLVRDFVPVRVGTVGYLYDRVSGTLFGNAADNNAGFAAACCGPDKVCATQTALAPVYDSSKTYAVGACVTHEGSLWKCTTAVSTAEAFNGAKWQNVTLLREALCDIVYPVGSIYTSVNSTSPATLFGGIWERITGRFLLAGTDSGSSGADQAPGNTGGEATHTLTASELPKIEGSFRAADNVAVNNNRSSILIDHSGVFTGTTETGNQVVLNGGTYSVQSYSLLRVTNLSFGSDSEHNNMPPYLSVYVWKRTA